MQRLSIGTVVLVRDLDGREHRTRVRGTPWRRCGVDVLLVDGRVGPIPLSRVRLAPQLELFGGKSQ